MTTGPWMCVYLKWSRCCSAAAHTALPRRLDSSCHSYQRSLSYPFCEGWEEKRSERMKSKQTRQQGGEKSESENVKMEGFPEVLVVVRIFHLFALLFFFLFIQSRIFLLFMFRGALSTQRQRLSYRMTASWRMAAVQEHPHERLDSVERSRFGDLLLLANKL